MFENCTSDSSKSDDFDTENAVCSDIILIIVVSHVHAGGIKLQMFVLTRDACGVCVCSCVFVCVCINFLLCFFLPLAV